MRVEDAVNATKAAISEGIISGGGRTLCKIYKILKKELKVENDIYPTEAKKACDGFIDMYTKGGKLRNVVLW